MTSDTSFNGLKITHALLISLWSKVFFITFTHLPISFFHPVLVMIVLLLPKARALSLVYLFALIIDLTLSPERLGIITSSYFITSLILYYFHNLLFHDKWVTLPILTAIFSLLTNLTHVTLLVATTGVFSFSFQLIFFELIFFPLTDAVYAFFFFTLPTLLLPQNFLKTFTLTPLKLRSSTHNASSIGRKNPLPTHTI